MPDAPIVTSPHTIEDRAHARRLVAAWLAGTGAPPEDDLRIQPLRDDVNDDICFCSGTFCWPPIETFGQRTGTDPAPTDLE